MVESECHDYPENDQDRVQAKYESAMYVDPYDIPGKQIWADAILARKLQEEESEQFSKQSSQTYYLNII